MTSPLKFRKKPVVIEAMRFGEETYEAILEWAEQDIKPGEIIPIVPASTGNPKLVIHTLEGTMYATPGDYIIRGVAGEFYPCKLEIFHATYEEVTP